MKKTVKLKKNYEFNIVFKKGKYYKGNYIECFYIKNNKKNNNYIGIAISSKLCNAVKRNRIKRIIIEAYSKLEENTKSGNTIVFLWNKATKIEKCSFTNIYNDMIDIFKRMEIINE